MPDICFKQMEKMLDKAAPQQKIKEKEALVGPQQLYLFHPDDFQNPLYSSYICGICMRNMRNAYC